MPYSLNLLTNYRERGTLAKLYSWIVEDVYQFWGFMSNLAIGLSRGSLAQGVRQGLEKGVLIAITAVVYSKLIRCLGKIPCFKLLLNGPVEAADWPGE